MPDTRWDAFTDEEIDALWSGLANTQIEWGLDEDEETLLAELVSVRAWRKHQQEADKCR